LYLIALETLREKDLRVLIEHMAEKIDTDSRIRFPILLFFAPHP
jgi:hypothetical protein